MPDRRDRNRLGQSGLALILSPKYFLPGHGEHVDQEERSDSEPSDAIARKPCQHGGAVIVPRQTSIQGQSGDAQNAGGQSGNGGYKQKPDNVPLAAQTKVNSQWTAEQIRG